jgi:hypothetical protein
VSGHRSCRAIRLVWKLIGIVDDKILLDLETFVYFSVRPLINVYTMSIEPDHLFGWVFSRCREETSRKLYSHSIFDQQ